MAWQKALGQYEVGHSVIATRHSIFRLSSFI